MGHYIANVRDLEFNLFEVLGLGTVVGSGRYGDLDVDTMRTMLDEVARLAEGPVADSFADADRNPPIFATRTRPAEVLHYNNRRYGIRSRRQAAEAAGASISRQRGR